MTRRFGLLYKGNRQNWVSDTFWLESFGPFWVWFLHSLYSFCGRFCPWSIGHGILAIGDQYRCVFGSLQCQKCWISNTVCVRKFEISWISPKFAKIKRVCDCFSFYRLPGNPEKRDIDEEWPLLDSWSPQDPEERVKCFQSEFSCKPFGLKSVRQYKRKIPSQNEVQGSIDIFFFTNSRGLNCTPFGSQ